MGPRAGLDVLEKRKILCLCQESRPGSSSPSPSHYKGDMHSKCLLISFLLLVINLLVHINTYTALQVAGFNFLTWHMCWPIIATLVQPCWAVFPLLLL